MRSMISRICSISTTSELSSDSVSLLLAYSTCARAVLPAAATEAADRWLLSSCACARSLFRVYLGWQAVMVTWTAASPASHASLGSQGSPLLPRVMASLLCYSVALPLAKFSLPGLCQKPCYCGAVRMLRWVGSDVDHALHCPLHHMSLQVSKVALFESTQMQQSPPA